MFGHVNLVHSCPCFSKRGTLQHARYCQHSHLFVSPRLHGLDFLLLALLEKHILLFDELHYFYDFNRANDRNVFD